MTASGVSDEVGELIAERGDTFWNLARRIALGEDVDAERIADILRDAGRNPEELNDAVAQLKHRTKLRERAADVEAKRERLNLLMGQVDRANAALDEAVRDHRQTVSQLSGEIKELRDELTFAQNIDAELARSCPVKSFAKEKLALEGRLKGARFGLNQARKTVEGLQTSLTQAHPMERAALQHRLERANEDLRLAEEMHAQIAARQNAIFHAMIDF